MYLLRKNISFEERGRADSHLRLAQASRRLRVGIFLDFGNLVGDFRLQCVCMAWASWAHATDKEREEEREGGRERERQTGPLAVLQ